MTDEPEKPVCHFCGGEDILADAWAEWDRSMRRWPLSDTFENRAHCMDCESDTKINWVPDEKPDAGHKPPHTSGP